MEDRDVAERAIDIWPALVKVIGHYQSLAPSKGPQKNLSYETLVKHYAEKFVPLKACSLAIFEGLKVDYWFSFHYRSLFNYLCY